MISQLVLMCNHGMRGGGGGVEAIVGNSANTRIWNWLDDFVVGSMSYFEDTDNVGVLTIDKNSSWPVGKGTVIISLTEDSGCKSKVELCDCLYFPDSPVNIISVSALAQQYHDENGTWIKSWWGYSTFQWDHEKHFVTFAHPRQVNCQFYMYQHVIPTLLHLHQYSLKLVWSISFLQWLHARHACHLILTRMSALPLVQANTIQQSNFIFLSLMSRFPS